VKVLIVLVLIVAAVGAFLYYPRGGSSTSAENAATLAILNTAIEGSRAGAGFAPALDGEVYASGDLVRANVDGRAILTFFDASTLSVDPGSQVKVLALNNLGNGGIQVTVEQTLGRSWSSVQKLKTPDSRYEVRTPSTTAVVRGTAFLTLVGQQATGGTATTYQVDEGSLQVAATAGGTVTVPAGFQVIIAEGQTAPAEPTPIPPSPRLEITATAGLGFLAVAPTGATCGPTGSKAEVFGCVVTPTKIVVRDPVPGRWGLLLNAPAAAPGATIVVNGLAQTGRGVSRAISRSLNAGELIRSGISVTPGPPMALSQFEELSLVTSTCAATAPGRVFASGPFEARMEAVRAFSRESKGAPVSVVYTEAELNEAANAAAPSSQGVTLSETKIRIDSGGIHGTAKAATQFITLDAKADIVGGPVGDKFTLRVARLSADPLPPGLVDVLRGLVDTSAADISGAIPFPVKQVAFRNGCFWVSGVTPA
jgi:hypothetical protein